MKKKQTRKPGRKTVPMRIPIALAEQCRLAISDEGLPTSYAVELCAELGVNILNKKLTIVNNAAWRQASLEHSQRSVIAAMKLIGIEARINDAGEIAITIQEPIQSGEYVGRIPGAPDEPTLTLKAAERLMR